jgi:hypothetical protein
MLYKSILLSGGTGTMFFQVIFNDVPLKTLNYPYTKPISLPIQRVFEVDEVRELYNKIDECIDREKLLFSSYEIDLISK